MSRTCAMPTPPMRGPATTHDEERSAAAPIGAGTRPPSALAGSLVGQSRRGSGCLGAAEERRLVRRRRRLPLPPPRHTPPQAHHDLTPPHSAWLASARQAPQPTAGPTADRDGTARERHAPSRAEPLQRPPAASSARLPVGRLGQLAGWAGSRLTGFWPTAAQPPPAHGPAQASLIPVSRVAPSISECRLAALVFAPPSPPVPPPPPVPAAVWPACRNTPRRRSAAGARHACLCVCAPAARPRRRATTRRRRPACPRPPAASPPPHTPPCPLTARTAALAPPHARAPQMHRHTDRNHAPEPDGCPLTPSSSTPRRRRRAGPRGRFWPTWPVRVCTRPRSASCYGEPRSITAARRLPPVRG